jgi:hypothetical protein
VALDSGRCCGFLFEVLRPSMSITFRFLTNKDDGRMTPKTFEGYTFQGSSGGKGAVGGKHPFPVADSKETTLPRLGSVAL